MVIIHRVFISKKYYSNFMGEEGVETEFVERKITSYELQKEISEK